MDKNFQTTFFVAVVLLILYILIRFSRKAVKAEYDHLVDYRDFKGLCYFYEKQLYWWTPLFAVLFGVIIVHILDCIPVERLVFELIVFGIVTYKTFSLSWCLYKNLNLFKKDVQEQIRRLLLDEEDPYLLTRELRDALGKECNVVYLENCNSPESLTQAYYDAKAECAKKGLCPMILQLEHKLIDKIKSNSQSSIESLSGSAVMEQMKKDLKMNYAKEEEWNKLVGDEDQEEYGTLDTLDGFEFEWARFAMAKVPIERASDIFNKIPIGGWKNCPTAEKHKAIAEYWYEKYGAVPCLLSYDIVVYYVPNPIDYQGSFELAVEQTAYDIDLIQGHENIWALAKYIDRSAFWYFWWE